MDNQQAQPQKSWIKKYPIAFILILFIGIPLLLSIIRGVTSSGQEQVSPEIVKQKQEEEQGAQKQQEETLKKLAGVEIISSKIVLNSIGTPELYVSVKNKSGKAIDALVISAILYNNFDELVGEWNAKTLDLFYGRSQDILQPNATDTFGWNLTTRDSARKAEAVKVVRIHFVDGEDISIDDIIN